MQKLLASDVVYEQVVRPEIDGVLANNGISGYDVPESTFLADEKWLEESTVSEALGRDQRQQRPATSGVHGTGTRRRQRQRDRTGRRRHRPRSAAKKASEVEVQVKNQGESTENGVTVSVTVEGNTIKGEIDNSPPAKPARCRSR